MKKNILVPFDGSGSSLAALNLAIDLAAPLKEKVVVLNIQSKIPKEFIEMLLQKKVDDSDVLAYKQQMFEQNTAPARGILTVSGVAYDFKMRIGIAKDQICQEATEGNYRMIVMGSRGMNPILGGVLGSVSYGVLNNATCPVTIVPDASLTSGNL